LIEPINSLEEIFQIVTLEFKKATNVKRHPFKYVVMNTTNGTAENSRYVVLRKYTVQGTFLIFTDARSEKMTNLKTSNTCSLLFYHDGKKLQARVNGTVIIHQNNEVTQQYWNGVKGTSDKAYTSVLAPGEKITKPEDAYAWDEKIDSSNFTVLEIVPTEIEILQLNRDEHIRAQYANLEGKAEATFIAP
jgi:pyridoxine/pyridoxamine 5'-phosphate oxidase